MGYRVAFVTHDLSFFASHRLHLVEAMRPEFGPVVVHPARDPAGPRLAGVVDLAGVPMERLLGPPWREAVSVIELRRTLRRLRPALVHSIGMKAVYLACAASAAQGYGHVDTFTGLGRWFRGTGWHRDLRAAAACRAYVWQAQRRRRFVAQFQNAEDRAEYLRHGLPAAATAIVGGAGVALGEYADPPWPRPLRVALVARTVWAKGVRTFVDAARYLRPRWPDCEFVVAGSAWSDDPDRVTQSFKDEATRDVGIRWLGHVGDVAGLLQATRVVCLPSLSEGTPKVLQEAAAAMCVRVGSDIPGIATVITDGIDGLLHRAGDARALAACLDRVLADPFLAERLARAGRERALGSFGIEHVQQATLTTYRLLCQ